MSGIVASAQKRQSVARIIKCSIRMVQNGVTNDFTWVQSQQNPMDFWLKSPPVNVTPNPKRRYSVRYVAMTADAAF